MSRNALVTAVVLLTLLLVTPVCGALFGCGCEWPWKGLFVHCASLRGLRPACPWCELPVLGIASIALPILGGIGFVRASKPLWRSQHKAAGFSLSAPVEIAATLVMGGLGVAAGFALAAILTPAIGPSRL